MTSGVYQITNAVSGNFYIGSSKDIKKRWGAHKTALRSGTHRNKPLQRAWDKNGCDVFSLSVLGRCAPEHLILFEQAWVEARSPEYNAAPVAGTNLGVKHTAESRANMSAAQKGRPKAPFTAEHRANMSKARLGRSFIVGFKHPPEFGAAVSARRKGMKFTAAHCANMAAANLGKKLSAEHKAEISKSLKLAYAEKRR